MKRKQRIEQAISDYTGLAVNAIDVCDDPKVARTIAVRATLSDGHVITCLFVGEISASNLEEVEFSEWPPTSDGDRVRPDEWPDFDQSNPTDVSAETWSELLANDPDLLDDDRQP